MSTVLRKFLCTYSIFACEIKIHQIGNFGKQVVIHFNTQETVLWCCYVTVC